MSMLAKTFEQNSKDIVAAAQDANTRFNASINNNSSGKQYKQNYYWKNTTSTTTSTNLQLNLEKNIICLYFFFIKKEEASYFLTRYLLVYRYFDNCFVKFQL